MMLRHELAIRRPDFLSRCLTAQTEEAEQLGTGSLGTREERRASSTAIRAPRPRVLCMIHVFEAVGFTKASQCVRVKSEAEAQVEQRRVLTQRDGAGARGDELDGALEQGVALLRRRGTRVGLGPVRHVDAAR